VRRGAGRAARLVPRGGAPGRRAAAEDFSFALLSDFWPHGAVARSYGVLDENIGAARRGTFIMDKAGVVRWKVINPIPQARDVADYQKALAELI
jgi:mycoredoxin-dependent peroxiredoxin